MSGRRKILAILVTLLAATALGISAYLTWVTWQSESVAGCTANALVDCDDVLSSKWSKWFGLPVSLLGGVAYLAILSLCWPAALRPQGWAVFGLFAMSLVAVGAGVWFVGLQVMELESYCPYCLTIHACGVVISLLALWLLVDDSGGGEAYAQPLFGAAGADSSSNTYYSSDGFSVLRLVISLVFSSAGLSALIAGQVLTEPPETMVMEEIKFQPVAKKEDTSDPSNDDKQNKGENQAGNTELVAEGSGQNETSGSDVNPTTQEGSDETTSSSIGYTGVRRISYEALPDRVNVSALPMLGDPQAEHVLIELMDYTCKHCRHMHPHIHAALEHFDGKIAIAIHHTPLSKKCNPNVVSDRPETKYACDYAQLAVGVWMLAPEKFPEFHNWLMESERPPNISKARSRAMKLVGSEILTNKKNQAEIGKQLAQQCENLNRLNSGLPILLMTNGAIRGVPEKSEKLFGFIESKFNDSEESLLD